MLPSVWTEDRRQPFGVCTFLSLGLHSFGIFSRSVSKHKKTILWYGVCVCVLVGWLAIMWKNDITIMNKAWKLIIFPCGTPDITAVLCSDVCPCITITTGVTSHFRVPLLGYGQRPSRNIVTCHRFNLKLLNKPWSAWFTGHFVCVTQT